MQCTNCGIRLVVDRHNPDVVLCEPCAEVLGCEQDGADKDEKAEDKEDE